MRLYFSSLGNAQRFIIDFVSAFPIPRALVSYAYPKGLEKLKAAGFRSFFVDSGAWSAFNSGASIDINKFIEWGKSIEGEVDAIANLDDIEDAQKSLENYRHITKRGLDVWPVYHFGEPEEYLEAYLAETDHICIGGLVGTGTNLESIRVGLNRLFYRYGTNIKVHTFGLNCFDILFQFPIYSTDAMTWRSGSRFGDVFIHGRRFKAGRKSRSSQFDAVAEYLREHHDMDVEDEEFKYTDLDLYNLGYLYDTLEVEHSQRDFSNMVFPQVLY